MDENGRAIVKTRGREKEVYVEVSWEWGDMGCSHILCRAYKPLWPGVCSSEWTWCQSMQLKHLMKGKEYLLFDAAE